MHTAHNKEPDVSVHHSQTCSPIIDLRQYTLYPGTRDAFVELFDREFVETQEAVGMRIIGQFRDIGDPNRFVWMRGFQDMPSREKSLTDFYMHGAAWTTHSETARSMMIDSTDALLLHPARPDSGFLLEPAERRPSLDSARSSRPYRCNHLSSAKSGRCHFSEFLRERSNPGVGGGRRVHSGIIRHRA
jgi:hypothetical protein